MDPKLRRRWYQFSLWTFFVLVTLACVGFGWWVHRSREWIRQRHAAFDDPGVIEADAFLSWRPATPVLAPWRLRVFGEKSHVQIVISTEAQISKAEIERLFPEAIVKSFQPP